MYRVRPALVLALLVSLGLPLSPAADDTATTAELTRCMQQNVPEPSSVRAVRFVSRDRLESETTTVVKLFGRRADQGMREYLVRFEKPEDMQGAALLVLERAAGNEMYFRSPDLGGVKRISGAGRAVGLFGSHFSYEDFERVTGLADLGSWKRLDDYVLGDRPVYVVESRPDPSAGSAYERVVSYVDHETCVLLRLELYEEDRRLRKILTVNPQQVQKRGPIWIAHASMMRDLRDFTTTQMLVDSAEQASLAADLFTVEGLKATPASP